jgi:DNA-binding response OmpR family regulator
MSRILLVDDETDVLDVVSTRLSALHHDVVTAGDGLQALDVLQRTPVDLMVLDLRMPRMDGLSLLARLRGGAPPRPPTLVMTAHGSPGIHEGVLAYGADDYIEKPFSGRDLMAKVERLLKDGPPAAPFRPSVLIVEDNADLRDSMSVRLAGMGYAVAQAGDWRRGGALAQIEKPDLVLLDILLPETDGHHACFDLKRDPRLADVPVVMVTAVLDPIQHEKARQLGADAVVTKPVEWGRLDEILKRLIHRKTAESTN